VDSDGTAQRGESLSITGGNSLNLEVRGHLKRL
jgi:hypothetical protein